jgi:hypothetical protein
VNLKEMEASDMLDVLHYLLDEDLAFKNSEEAEAKSGVRTALYRHLLEKEYRYATGASSSPRNFSDMGSMPENFNYGTPSNERKPFIPATNFDFDSDNPFEGVLREAPLR